MIIKSGAGPLESPAEFTCRRLSRCLVLLFS